MDSERLDNVKKSDEFDEIQVKFEPLEFLEINPEDDGMSEGVLFEECGDFEENTGDEEDYLVVAGLNNLLLKKILVLYINLCSIQR